MSSTLAAFEAVSPSDRAELMALCMEYAWRIDNGHASTVWELFTEDGVCELPWGSLDGRPALQAAWADRGTRAIRTRHLVSNARFARISDDEISGTIALTLFVRKRGEPMIAEVAAVGEHVDAYRRDPSGRWRIHRRRFVTLFSNDPALPPLPYE